MDSYEEFLLDATKDSVNVLRGEGSTNEEIVEFLNTATEGIGVRSPEFMNEIDTLKRKFERDDIFEQLGTTPAKEVISFAEEKGVDPLRLIRDEKILDLLSEKLEIKADISMMLGDIDRIGDLPSREDDFKMVNGKLDYRVSELTKEVNLDDLIKGAVEKTEDQPIKNNPVKEMER